MSESAVQFFLVPKNCLQREDAHRYILSQKCARKIQILKILWVSEYHRDKTKTSFVVGRSKSFMKKIPSQNQIQ